MTLLILIGLMLVEATSVMYGILMYLFPYIFVFVLQRSGGFLSEYRVYVYMGSELSHHSLVSLFGCFRESRLVSANLLSFLVY